MVYAQHLLWGAKAHEIEIGTMLSAPIITQREYESSLFGMKWSRPGKGKGAAVEERLLCSTSIVGYGAVNDRF